MSTKILFGELIINRQQHCITNTVCENKQYPLSSVIHGKISYKQSEWSITKTNQLQKMIHTFHNKLEFHHKAQSNPITWDPVLHSFPQNKVNEFQIDIKPTQYKKELR